MSATGIGVFEEAQERGAMEALLDVAILQAHLQGAYVYRFGRAGTGVALAAFAGSPPEETHGDAMDRGRTTPVVLHSQAGSDRRFRGFPEFQSGRCQGVVSVPLVDGGEVVGLANFCRTVEAPFAGGALAFLMNLSLPLGALLGTSALRDQLRKATQDLADRKLVERAKGMVQAHWECSEEEAYLRMRKSSRQRRIRLREIAQEVIAGGAGRLEQAGVAHA